MGPVIKQAHKLSNLTLLNFGLSLGLQCPGTAYLYPTGPCCPLTFQTPLYFKHI